MVPSPLGMIGLGLLGSALAERLLPALHGEMVGWDIDPKRRSEFRALGGRPADAMDEIASQCSVLWLVLPDSRVVAEVIDLLGPQLRAGQIVIDSSTGDPADAERASARLREAGVSYLECTILGSSAQVRAHEAVALTGGEPAALEACRPLMATVAQRTFDLGRVGDASRMKLVANLVLGLNRAVLAEGLGLAEAYGLDLGLTLEVLKSGGAQSRVMETKGNKMIERDYTPQARLSQHAKDVRLILQDASRLRAMVPLTQVHEELLSRLELYGLGGLDNAAIIEAYRSGSEGEGTRPRQVE